MLGGTSGTSNGSRGSRSQSSAQASACCPRPKTAGTATRPGRPPATDFTAAARRPMSSARCAGSSKRRARCRALRLLRAAMPASSTATPATWLGRSEPPQTVSRPRLSAMAAGQKSLKPAIPATTSSSSGSQGRRAAACAAGTMATRRVPPMAVGTRRIGVSSVPA